MTSIITAYYRLQKDFTSHHEVWEENDIKIDQKVISTKLGPSHCISIAGIDYRQLRVNPKRSRGFILHPVFAMRIDEEATTTDQDLNKAYSESNPEGSGASSPESETSSKPTESTMKLKQRNLYRGEKSWSRQLSLVTDEFPWLRNQPIPDLVGQSAVYQLASTQNARSVPWVWVPISSRAEVSCLDARHVHSQMQAIKKTSEEISQVISFFEKTQNIPFNESFHPVGDEYFKCDKEMLPLSVLRSLSFKASMEMLGITNQECREMQNLGTMYRNLFSNHKVKRSAGDVIDFILRNPSKDYGPVREALSHLKNNIILNHDIILHQDLKFASLYRNQLREAINMREVSGSISVDSLLSLMNAASQENAENLRFTMASFNNIFLDLEKECLRVAGATHSEGDCFFHQEKAYCLRAIPRAALDLEGILQVKYLVEKIALEQKKYFSCLPTEIGLSKKHNHYAVASSKTATLLDDGLLIPHSKTEGNSTDPQFFDTSYEDKIVAIKNCYFNLIGPKIELCCKYKSSIQYDKGSEQSEIVTIDPFSVLVLKVSNFPIYISGESVSLDRLRNELDVFRAKEIYATPVRKLFYSGLYLPAALEKSLTKEKHKRHWHDIYQVSQRFPSAYRYFWGMTGFTIFVFMIIICGCGYRFRVQLTKLYRGLRQCLGCPTHKDNSNQSEAMTDRERWQRPPRYRSVSNVTNRDPRARSRSPRYRDNWTNVQDKRAARPVKQNRPGPSGGL